MELDEVVPWGRNMAEYQAMFALNQHDRTKHILGCSDGPASFNTEWTQSGGKVVSVDPIYQFTRDYLQQRIEQTAPLVMQQVRQHQDDFIWNNIQNAEELLAIRMTAMQQFLDDFDKGIQNGRYIPAALPKLPFAEQSFDLALCSHFLFLYSHVLNRQFHLNAIQELCRVAAEVRVYPLVDLNNQISTHLVDIIQDFNDNRYSVSLVPVSYQFQRGATDMLVIQKRGLHDQS